MLKRYFTVAFLLALSLNADAQAAFRSVEEVWKYADQHNITIRTVKYELDKSGYSTKMAYSSLLPQVAATGSYTDNIALQTTLIPETLLGGPPGTYRTLQFGQQFVYAGGISAQMSIFNLQRWDSLKIARQTEDMNKDSLAATRKSVYQQLATQYYAYLLMQEALRIAVQASLVGDSVYESTDNKYKEGTLNQANVDVAKLNWERAQQTEITARYQMATAINNLKALLGFALTDSLSINGSLQTDLSVEADAPFMEDPSVKLALQKTRISLAQYHAANSAFLPTINILYNYATQRYDKTFEPFEGATGVAGWFPSQYWSLQASWPVFTSGARYFNSKKNKLNYNESKEQYEFASKQSVINDENIRLNYRKAVAVLGKAKDVMELSFDNYQHIADRYEAGMAPIDDRLNAFKDYLDYQNQYLNSLSDMLTQLYQVKIRQQSF